jgi:hypothetical protein
MVDKILFHVDGTLVQKAIALGNRGLFWQLVQEFHADVARPWSKLFADAEDEFAQPAFIESSQTRLYVNCYSILALHSKDLWFAYVFLALILHPSHYFESLLTIRNLRIVNDEVANSVTESNSRSCIFLTIIWDQSLKDISVSPNQHFGNFAMILSHTTMHGWVIRIIGLIMQLHYSSPLIRDFSTWHGYCYQQVPE